MFLIATFYVSAVRATEMTSDGMTPYAESLAKVIKDETTNNLRAADGKSTFQIAKKLMGFESTFDKNGNLTTYLVLLVPNNSEEILTSSPDFAAAQHLMKSILRSAVI